MNCLFLAGYESDILNANYKIIMSIAKELIKRGHSVKVLSVGTDYNVYLTNGVEMVSIGNHRSKKMARSRQNVLLKGIQALDYQLQGMKQSLYYPDRDRVSSCKVLHAIKNHIGDFDMIIAFSKPYFNISALSRMTKLAVPRFAYILDLYDDLESTDINERKKSVKKYYQKDYKYVKRIDAIMVPPAGIEVYQKMFSDKLFPIVSCVDFPTFISIENSYRFVRRFQDKKKHFLIYGSLDEVFRNPVRLLELIKIVSKPLNIEFDFFCRGCDDIISQFIEDEACDMRLFPIVEYSELREYIWSADVLINISNESNVMIPSKLFEMFAFGKPILDFSVDGNNSSKEYLDLYPNVKKLYSKDSIVKTVSEFEEWFLKMDDSLISFDALKKIYYQNTPEYVVNRIIELFEKVKKS